MMEPHQLKGYLWSLEHEIAVYLGGFDLTREGIWEFLHGLLVAGLQLGILKTEPEDSIGTYGPRPYKDVLMRACDRVTAEDSLTERLNQAAVIAQEFMDKYVSPEAKAFLKKE